MSGRSGIRGTLIEYAQDELKFNHELFKRVTEYYDKFLDLGMTLEWTAPNHTVPYGQIDIRDLFDQSFKKDEWHARAFFCERLHQHYACGDIKVIPVEVGDVPGKDKEVDRNNGTLQNLPSPFSAECWSGTYGCDGRVHWGESECLGKTYPEYSFRSGIPLEIGYCDPWLIIQRLIEEKQVARWPYRSCWLYLIGARRGVFSV